ncbi:hypothetical protein AB9R84_09180 [Oceanimonas smirnovii]|uniref:hypothetical protein n=1 Tax=Oceanimonas smirnovii TaxID=264574 RepID=UPI003AAED0DD
MKEVKTICTHNVEEFVAVEKSRKAAKEAEKEYQQLKIDHANGLINDEERDAGYKKMRQAQKAHKEAHQKWYS